MSLLIVYSYSTERPVSILELLFIRVIYFVLTGVAISDFLSDNPSEKSGMLSYDAFGFEEGSLLGDFGGRVRRNVDEGASSWNVART